MWVDMDELARERDEVVGQDVADAAMVELQEINRGRKRIGRTRRRLGLAQSLPGELAVSGRGAPPGGSR